MTKYFISYYTESPRELYCRCCIAPLSDEGLDLFKRESGIDNILAFALECITDIPCDTVEERYRHDEALRKFDRERHNPSVLEWLMCSDCDRENAPNRNCEHIGTMVKLQRLAEDIEGATNEPAGTTQGLANSDPTSIPKRQSGRPSTLLNKHFIERSRQEPNKSVPELIDEFNKLPSTKRAGILGVLSAQVKRISTKEEQAAIYAAVNRDKKKQKTKQRRQN